MQERCPADDQIQQKSRIHSAKEPWWFCKGPQIFCKRARDIPQKSHIHSAQKPHISRNWFIRDAHPTTKCSKSAVYIPQKRHNYSDIPPKSHIYPETNPWEIPILHLADDDQIQQKRHVLSGKQPSLFWKGPQVFRKGARRCSGTDAGEMRIHEYTWVCIIYIVCVIYINTHKGDRRCSGTDAGEMRMRWLRLVGSINHRSLLQKSPIKETLFCQRDL